MNETDEATQDLFFRKLIITEIREEIKDFKTFVFREEQAIPYQAGQFITLVDQSGPSEIRRSYSMHSTPVLNEPLAISVKRVDNGFFSRKLVDQARIGDLLLTTGAAGFFILPENIKTYRSVFFLAAGSGIVPILSLIKTVLHLYPEIKNYLVYSNPSVETTAFYNELKTLEKRFPNQLFIDFIFSSYPDLRKARLNRELLLEIISIRGFNKQDTLFYTCGPENYMRMISFLLQEEGFPKENIKKEDFYAGLKKRILHSPPDKNNYQVHLTMKGKSYDFPVKYPDSILQSARKLKLDLPFSCETGVCGSCAAICVSGEVWLSNNEVLTEEDIQKGYILTCTGHPQKGNLVLKID